jgi:hypothetical protein
VKIFNIRTGQILRLETSKSVLDYIIVTLLKGKYEKQVPSTDEEFLTACRKFI